MLTFATLAAAASALAWRSGSEHADEVKLGWFDAAGGQNKESAAVDSGQFLLTHDHAGAGTRGLVGFKEGWASRRLPVSRLVKPWDFAFRRSRWSVEFLGFVFSSMASPTHAARDVVIPCYAVTGLLSAVTLPLWLRRGLRWAQRRRAEADGALACDECGYDLRASQERCPECGAEVPIARP